MYWIIGGDIMVSSVAMGSGKFLNEIPISKELDSFMIE